MTGGALAPVKPAKDGLAGWGTGGAERARAQTPRSAPGIRCDEARVRAPHEVSGLRE